MSKSFYRKVVAPVTMLVVATTFGNVACSSESENADNQDRIGAVFNNALDSGLCANRTNGLDTETSIELPNGDVVIKSDVIGDNSDYGLYDGPAESGEDMPGLAFVSDDTSRFVDEEGRVSIKSGSVETRQEGVGNVADSATDRIISGLAGCIL